VPNLAESVTSNPAFTEWTIKLRPNIKFHNGEPLNADALKLNIDSWRGANPNLPARLFIFVYNNIADVQKVDDLTVKVVTKTPWAALPSYLYNTGRSGIMAPAQINLGSAGCATNMIGTGPFKLNSPSDWKVNESLTVVKNPDYWKKDAKGKQLPYLDKITFVPVPDSPTRDTQLQGGQLDLVHTSSAQSIDRLKTVAGVTETTEKAGNRDVRYYLINTSKAPFDNPDARLALAYALNVPEINTIRNKGMFDVTNSIIDSKGEGYVKNTKFPKYNLNKAKDLVQKVKAASGGQFNVTFLTTNDTENLSEAQLLVEQAKEAGMNADIAQFDQSGLINEALGGRFSVLLWRNFHSDPAFGDVGNYVWWTQGSPINFGKINNPEIQADLDTGRTSADDGARSTAYQEFNMAMSAGTYVVPAWFVDWTIAAKGVKGTAGAPLPDGSKPRFMYGRIPVDSLVRSN
jgi:peptide/nickel transport system substrate-binding protein